MGDDRRSWVLSGVDWSVTRCRHIALRQLPVALALAAQLACGRVADDNKLPPNVQDPATLKTPSGALARYRGTLAHVPRVIDWVMFTSAIVTDELDALPAPRGQVGSYMMADSRWNLSEFSDVNATGLYNLRAQAHEARGFLAAYAPGSSPALQGHMYAVEGYAEIWLADLFCSGIPLSTLDFDGNYTLTPGFTTAEVYQHAAVLFDSALASAGDSVRVQYLAAVGKGRALLARREYAAAAAAVNGVPDNYIYQVSFTPGGSSDVLPDSAVLWYYASYYPYIYGAMSVADREGQNGLDYRSSGDPRTADTLLGTDRRGMPMYFPTKYPVAGAAAFTIASGVEARLIEAEAALDLGGAGSDWLVKLNALRTDGIYDTQPNANDPSKTDTLWHAGGGGMPGLRPLADPGEALSDPVAAKKAREDLVFRERAFWLYLTGHRQGDLRRLVRDYPGHPAEAVYPVGSYAGDESGSSAYGNEIVVPFPSSEQQLNPKYTGCFHRGA